MPNSNDPRRRPIGTPKTDGDRPTEVPLQQIPTGDAPRLSAELSSRDDGSASDIEREDWEVIVGALAKAIKITDHYDPRRNPGRSMRQLRVLFASARLRAALRRYDVERLTLE